MLHLAAEYAKKDTLMLLLQTGANPDVVMDLLQTPVMIACSQGHAEIVQCLLEFKNNLTTHDSHKSRPPLYIAVSNKHKSVVKVLLEFKADPNGEYKGIGRCCLHEAIRQGSLSIVKMLLTAGANPLTVDKWGNTSLHIASTKGSSEMVGLVMKSILSVKNKEGFTPIDLLSNDCPDAVPIKKVLMSKLN